MPPRFQVFTISNSSELTQELGKIFSWGLAIASCRGKLDRRYKFSSGVAIVIQTLPLHVAQITDLHLFSDRNKRLMGIDTAASLQKVLSCLRQLRHPQDLLLLTGDLSQDETPESYELLVDLLSPWDIPSYWIPGNHDDPSLMEQILKTPPFFTDKVVEAGNWSLILLDSTVTGWVSGQLSPSSLDWLEWQLERSRHRPTLIGLHHPPFAVNSEWIDSIALQNPDDFFAIVKGHPQVKLVLCGHVHQNFCHQQKYLRCFTTPSTCVQFKPGSAEFAVDSAQPGLRLFNLYPDGTWETKVMRVS
jgi:Icc protein